MPRVSLPYVPASRRKYDEMPAVPERERRRRRGSRRGGCADSGTSLVPTRNSSPLVDLVHLAAVGGEEPRLFHRLLAHEHRRHHRREALADEDRRDPLTSASSTSTASPMRYAKREPLTSAACSVSTNPIASPNAAWSSGGAAGCRRRPARPRRRPRRRRAPTRRPGSGAAARARGASASASARSSSSALELLLERARGRDLRRALVGRGLADLLRRRVLAGPELLDARVSTSRRGRRRRARRRSARRARACVRCRRGTRARRAGGAGRSGRSQRVLGADPPAQHRRATCSRRATPW